MIPSYAACFFKDGDAWCCVRGGFINLPESPAGFGYSLDEALNDLAAKIAQEESLQQRPERQP